jgi:hypothetical protein
MSKAPAAAAALPGSAGPAAAAAASCKSEASQGGTGVTSTMPPTMYAAGAAAGAQAPPPAAAAAKLPGHGHVGGIDIGDLDLPEAPPELEAILAVMLQREQQQQASLSAATEPAAARRSDTAAAAAAARGAASEGGAQVADRLTQSAPLPELHLAGTQQAHFSVVDAVSSGFTAGRSAADPDAVDAVLLQEHLQEHLQGHLQGQHLQEQLRQDLTDASAGLQGLWLNPDTSSSGVLNRNSPTWLGFSTAVGQTLQLPDPSPAGQLGFVRGQGGDRGLGWAPSGLNPAARGQQGLVSGQALPGPLSGLHGSAGRDPTAAAAATVVGAGGGGGGEQLPGSPGYMAAAAAAGGMPSWSDWHDEQQQWLDDIFSSGPTLPHE